MSKETFEIISEQAKQNREDFLNSFKKSYRFKSALKHGFTAAALSSVATGATAATLFGTGIIAAPFITLPFITLPLFVPVIAGVAGIIIASFLAGIVARYLYTPSKVYTDFYEEFESDEKGLFIDTYAKENNLYENNLQKQNIISKMRSIGKWENLYHLNEKNQLFWDKKHDIKQRYKEKFFQALKQDNKKLVDILSDNPFLQYIKKERDENHNTLLHLAAQQGHTKLVKILIRNMESEFYTENTKGETPLALAKKEGHKDIEKLISKETKEIQELIQAIKEGELKPIQNIKDYQIQFTDRNGNSLLHLAAVTNNRAIEKKDIIKTLIDKGADIHGQNEDLNTPLHLAAFLNNMEAVQMLLSSGADIYAKNQHSKTPLQLANEKNNIDAASLLKEESEKRKKIFKAFLDKELNLEEINKYISQIKNENGNSLLHLAVTQKEQDIAKKLIETGADVNAENSDRNTPLHLAALHGYEEILLMLIKKKAEINAENKDKNTPLHVATLNGHIEATGILIKQGAEINAKNKDKNTPLHFAAVSGHNKIVKMLLQDKEINVNAVNENNITPLHYAVVSGHNKIVKMLIDKKANLNAKNKKGNTPLHLAISGNKPDIAKMLIDKAKAEDLDIQNDNGETPLHLAIKKGNIEIFEMLIENGANPNIQNEQENTPLHIAMLEDYLVIAQKLIKNNANIFAKNSSHKTPFECSSEISSADSIFNAIKTELEEIFKDEAYILTKENDNSNTKIKSVEDAENFLKHELEKRKIIFERCQKTELKVEEIDNKIAKIKDKEGNSLLHLAAKTGQFDVVQKLIKKQANVNATNKELKTPLHLATAEAQLDIIKELLKQKNIQVNYKDIDGFTPLHIAASCNDKEKLVELLNELFKKKSDFNARSNDGNTPLHIAVKNSNAYMVKELRESEKADLTIQNSDGKTPLQLAKDLNKPEISLLLDPSSWTNRSINRNTTPQASK